MLTRCFVAWSRLRALFGARAADVDFDAEVAAHIELLTEEHVRRGLAPAEARRLAILRFGGPVQIKEQQRENTVECRVKIGIRARVAGLGFFGLFAGLEMARGVLRNIFDAKWATLLSLQADIRAIGGSLFGVTLRRWEEVPVADAALVLAALAVGCLLLLRSRVRAVEIVR